MADQTISWADTEIETDIDKLVEQDPVNEALRRSTLVSRAPEWGNKGNRITWEQLAERFGLTDDSHIDFWDFCDIFPNRSWPRYLLGPVEGSMDRHSYGALITILESSTQIQVLFFQFFLMAMKDVQMNNVFRGNMGELTGLLVDGRVSGTPEYIWPELREWCVCTDTDSTFTIVGGKQSLIDAILDLPYFLVALPLDPNDQWYPYVESAQ
jgi:hypothetical protein